MLVLSNTLDGAFLDVRSHNSGEETPDIVPSHRRPSRLTGRFDIDLADF